MTDTDRLHLGVALEGAGWHPSAWREESSRPKDLFTPQYWVDVVQQAEAAGIDFATIEDSFAVQSGRPFGPDERTDEVRGRLDALLIASRVAPVTRRIGLIPTVTTTHTEPFHISKAVATLDHASLGRAGWQPKVSGRSDEARHFGRRDVPAFDDLQDPRVQEAISTLFAEADDVVEVVRRLWDSWQDDAEIRDAATDRFLDADKVHTIDFDGRWFGVRGPSITPRPPQGQPVVAALAHAEVPYRFAAASADLVFITPLRIEDAAGILTEVRAAETAVGREGEPLQVYADIVVFLDGTGETGTARLERLDGLARQLHSDARIFAGSASALADEIAALGELGYAGVRLRPGVVTDDLPRIADDLVPELRRRGLLADSDADSLRGVLGLPTTVPNRYAPALAG
ncbi:LLM class flavin-dependent oxidoreductase [Microbacterium oxydans]|uniref:Nitrilotriacetate monooxygenase component A n=1 Tax=Microbacterium oxydans TaxID=82380 RepID=A0A0F0L9G1_9MICO|nr:LLM class flavin-dependent oxidoreductase [Microbacterium oxydans]KJL29832.1 Nitrilotriacetate monooxygenase component A [Microbacterium oxydans]